MTDLLVAADVLGKNATTGSTVRALVVLRDAGNTDLLYVSEVDGSITVEEYRLTKIQRGGFSRIKNYTFYLEGRGPISVLPQNCTCGAGRVAYADPTPGYKRVPAIMPDGLEVRA